MAQAVEAELVRHNRLDTINGQRALFLAHRLLDEVDGSKVAAVSKELTAVLALALEGVSAAKDPLDELQERRDRLRAV